MLTYYAEADPQALWEAGAATALFIAGCGAFGYATRTDLSGLARVGFWALLALIGFGVVLIFVHIPGGAVIYSVLGLVIFAGLTMVDFQRLRRSTDMDSAPLIAASIFLDALNVFRSSCSCSGAGVGTDNHSYREPGRWPCTRTAFIEIPSKEPAQA